MIPTLKRDPDIAAKRFAASFRELSRLTGYDPRMVSRYEVGSVLKIVAGRVKVMENGEVQYRARLRAEKQAFNGVTNAGKNPFGISINTGKRGSEQGRVWFRTANKKFQMIGVVYDEQTYERMAGDPRHIKNQDFARASQGINKYMSELSSAFRAVQKSSGLSRQSVVQMADAIGIRLEDIPGAGASAQAIAKARDAIASNGQRYTNGTSYDRLDDNGKYFMRLINSLPYNTKIRLDSLISSVLAARAQRFAKAHEKGVFDSIAKIRRQYPWVKLVGNPPAIPSA